MEQLTQRVEQDQGDSHEDHPVRVSKLRCCARGSRRRRRFLRTARPQPPRAERLDGMARSHAGDRPLLKRRALRPASVGGPLRPRTGSGSLTGCSSTALRSPKPLSVCHIDHLVLVSPRAPESSLLCEAPMLSAPQSLAAYEGSCLNAAGPPQRMLVTCGGSPATAVV